MIPFHKPYYDATDEQALLSSFRSGRLVGDGPFTQQAMETLRSFLSVQHALLTTSCTHALELAVMAAGIRPEDEVIVPSFAFVSTPNCIMRQGARVVFTDVSEETLTMDAAGITRHCTERTKAVIPVVYAGIVPNMDEIMSVAREHNLLVIEDAAQGVDAWYKGRHAGTIGDIGCLSFHETKNFSTGEGGAFITNNNSFAQRAEIIREKGTNRKQFMLGLVDSYTWIDVGSSYLPPDTMSAILLSQLEKRAIIRSQREAIHRKYIEELRPLADAGLIRLPVIPEYVQSNYHIFFVLMSNQETRNSAIRFFRDKGVMTSFHYLPLHLSPLGKSLGYGEGDFPVTESVCGRLLRLPIYPFLTIEEQAYVVRVMKDFLDQC